MVCRKENAGSRLWMNYLFVSDTVTLLIRRRYYNSIPFSLPIDSPFQPFSNPPKMTQTCIYVYLSLATLCLFSFPCTPSLTEFGLDGAVISLERMAVLLCRGLAQIAISYLVSCKISFSLKLRQH